MVITHLYLHDQISLHSFFGKKPNILHFDSVQAFFLKIEKSFNSLFCKKSTYYVNSRLLINDY